MYEYKNEMNLTDIEEIFKNNFDYELMNLYLKPFHNYPKLTGGLKISNPFMDDKQKTPSFNLFKHKSGKWKYKDFATNDIGDVIDLVRKLFNLNFIDAKNIITKDLLIIKQNTSGNESVQEVKIISNSLKNEKKMTEVNKDNYEIVKREFNDDDRKFWYEKYSISKEILVKYNVCPISSFQSKGKIINPPMIAYSYDIGNGFKIVGSPYFSAV